MNEHTLARGRCLGYGLLADLVTNGVTETTREPARASAALAEAIDGRDDETLAVELERAFGWAAPPFEGAFLDAEGRVGGDAADSLFTLFGDAGFRPDLRSEDAEHLATSLRALAFLGGAEADAIEDSHARGTERTRELARELLDEHLLRWVPVWASAARRVGLAFPSALATDVELLLLAHRAALPSAPRAFELADFALDPAHPDTDLRAVAKLLTTPARSGVVLSRADVERLGRVVSVPRGFGERAQVLLNLLRSAARFEVFDDLLRALEAELEGQREALLDERYEGARDAIGPWRARALQTMSILGVMRDAAWTE